MAPTDPEANLAPIPRLDAARAEMTDENDSLLEVLLVEDSIDQALLMTRWLEVAGYQVTHAQDGMRGGSLAQERRWSAVVTDLNLPGSDGLEVIRASKQVHPDVPVVVVTAYKDQSHAAAAIREGADGFLHRNQPVWHVQSCSAWLIQKRFRLLADTVKGALARIAMRMDHRRFD